MPVIVRTNVPSLTAQRNLLGTGDKMATALQRLSSGFRINSAKDDAAGLAISDRMTSQVRGLNQAVRNSNDGISLAQTAEGALQESTAILQRMRELAIQSANDTNSPSDRASLQDEINQLKAEMNRIAETTQFNNKNLLDGTFGVAKFHVGALANQVINVSTGDARGLSVGAFQSWLEGSTEYGTVTHFGTDTNGDGVRDSGQDNIVINGSRGTGEADVFVTDSAKEASKKINLVNGETGVTATARTSLKISGIEARRDYKLEISAGGYTGTIAATVDKHGNLQDLIDSINDQSSRTGVVATLNNAGNEVTLVDHDGDTVEVRRMDKNDTVWTLNSDHSDDETGTISLKKFNDSDISRRVLSKKVGLDENGEPKAQVEGDGLTVTSTEDGANLGQRTLNIYNESTGSFENEAIYYGARVVDDDGTLELSTTGKPQFWATDEAGEQLYLYVNSQGQAIDASGGVVDDPDNHLYIKEGQVINGKAYIANKHNPGFRVGEDRVEHNLVSVRGHVLLEGAKNFSANEEGVGSHLLNKYDKRTFSSSISPVTDVNITTQVGSNEAISVIDKAIGTIDSIRSSLGAYQNRFSATISNLSNVSENIAASRSRVQDADFAQETAALTKQQILQQSGIAMLAQANQLPQAALSLINA